MLPRLLFPIFILTSGCAATIQQGDTDGPIISIVANTSAGPVLASSDDSIPMTGRVCAEGRTDSQRSPGWVYNSVGTNPQPMSFVFTDDSGIASYSINVATPALIDLPTETEVNDDGSLGTREIYAVTINENFQTVETVPAKITMIDTGPRNPFHGHQVVLRATDQLGNSTRYDVFMMNADLRCRLE